MKQRLLLLLMPLILCAIPALAHVIEVDGIYYVYANNKTELSVSYRGNSSSKYSNEYSENVVIPESVTYNGTTYPVTSIGAGAFSGCTGLTSVTIPNSVTTIGADAFFGCSNLKEIAIYSNVIMSKSFDYEESLRGNNFSKIFGKQVEKLIVGESVKSIGNYAFYRCTNLSSIIIPNSVTSIGAYAFHDTKWYENQPDGVIYAGHVAYNYKGIMPSGSSIALKEGTVGISAYAFRSCTGLTSVTIPNSVTSIGDYAFSGCSGLTSATIPNSVTSIGDYAFSGCSGLTSATIPNSVTSIGLSVFSNCSGLTSITIPNSVTNINNLAFYDCI